MVTVIRKDQFQRCFEFIVSFWPEDKLVQTSTGETIVDITPDTVHSNALFYTIYRNILDNMEFDDRRMLRRLNYGVFQAAKSVGDDAEGGLVSRDCIAAQHVEALVNKSAAWRVG